MVFKDILCRLMTVKIYILCVNKICMFYVIITLNDESRLQNFPKLLLKVEIVTNLVYMSICEIMTIIFDYFFFL